MISPSKNPCLACGACCAFFRVSFYWVEAGEGGTGVPIELTSQLSPHLSVMLGTNGPKPRCVALQGFIGKKVSCAIHPRRSSVCRTFAASWEDGIPQPGCDKARAHFDLLPLQPNIGSPTIRKKAGGG
jgi:hypothetical protein